MKNKILVYVVYFNHKEFIKYALDSIKQNLQSTVFDVVVVDASPGKNISPDLGDNVGEFCEIIKISEKLPQVIQTIYGKYLDTYDYIMRLDADDVLHPFSINQLMDAAVKNPNVSAFYGDWAIIDNAGRHIINVVSPAPDANIGFHGACTLLKTSSIKALDFSKMDITRQDGLETFIYLKKNSLKIKKLNKLIFSYRRHDTNLTRNEMSLWDAKRKILRFFVSEKELLKNSYKSILIDFDRSKFGNFDFDFLSNYTDMYYFREGTLHKPDGQFVHRIDRNAKISQEVLDFEPFEGMPIIFININKLNNYYFDGLIETFVLNNCVYGGGNQYFSSVKVKPNWVQTKNGFKNLNIKDGFMHPLYELISGLSIFADDSQRISLLTNNFLSGGLDDHI